MNPIQMRLQQLRDARLVVIEEEWSSVPPLSVREAWATVSSGYARPLSTVSRSTPDWYARLGNEWDVITADCRLRGLHEEFLVSTAGVGAADLSWTLVSGGSGEDLVRSLGLYPAEPEFVCMSTDGRVVCGVTSEEYDYWIVREFIAEGR